MAEFNPQTVTKEAESSMQDAVEALQRNLGQLRTGRASVALLDRIRVEAYDSRVPLTQVASLAAPEPRLLTIQPWDKSILSNIENAILKSDLGLTPNNDGNILRINIPMMTEERRKEQIKIAKKQSEEAKIALRNARQKANEAIKAAEKAGEVPKDDSHSLQNQIQELVNTYTKQVNDLVAEKESEILNF